MIADRRLRVIVDNPKLFDCFPGVEIKGGVNYFLWDRDHDGDCEFSTRIDGVIISTMTRDLREGDGVSSATTARMSIVHKVEQGEAKRRGEHVQPSKAVRPQDRTQLLRDSVPEPFDGAIPLIFASHVGYVRPDQIERNHEWIDSGRC